MEAEVATAAEVVEAGAVMATAAEVVEVGAVMATDDVDGETDPAVARVEDARKASTARPHQVKVARTSAAGTATAAREVVREAHREASKAVNHRAEDGRRLPRRRPGRQAIPRGVQGIAQERNGTAVLQWAERRNPRGELPLQGVRHRTVRALRQIRLGMRMAQF